MTTTATPTGPAWSSPKARETYRTRRRDYYLVVTFSNKLHQKDGAAYFATFSCHERGSSQGVCD